MLKSGFSPSLLFQKLCRWYIAYCGVLRILELALLGSMVVVQLLFNQTDCSEIQKGKFRKMGLVNLKYPHSIHLLVLELAVGALGSNVLVTLGHDECCVLAEHHLSGSQTLHRHSVR